MNGLNHARGEIRVTLSASPESVQLVVADDGPGLAEDELAHVFERFWRGSEARNRPGSGLGLPIVRGIVDAHHGELTLVSSPETGTSATVSLARSHPS